MEDVRNCAFCGKPFLKRTNQKYCCAECRIKATTRNKRLERQRIAELQAKRNSNLNPRCKELWKQYRKYKRLNWFDKLATIERQLKDVNCWFKRVFTLTKEEKRLAEQRDKGIA